MRLVYYKIIYLFCDAILRIMIRDCKKKPK